MARSSRITFTKSPKFCVKTLIEIITKLTVLLLQALHCSYYISRLILATPPLLVLVIGKKNCKMKLWLVETT
jgi:hypothetical protein